MAILSEFFAFSERRIMQSPGGTVRGPTISRRTRVATGGVAVGVGRTGDVSSPQAWSVTTISTIAARLTTAADCMQSRGYAPA